MAPALFPYRYMRKDPLIRYADDPAPFVPYSPERYSWPDQYDEDVALLRERMQEGGPGLFVFYRPDGSKAVVECYYPEDIRPTFFEKNLDPMRRSDVNMGRLVAVGEVMRLDERGVMSRIDELRANNRNSRQHFRRTHSPVDHRIALENLMEENEREIFNSVADDIAAAQLEAYGFSKAKSGPHVSSSER